MRRELHRGVPSLAEHINVEDGYKGSVSVLLGDHEWLGWDPDGDLVYVNHEISPPPTTTPRHGSEAFEAGAGASSAKSSSSPITCETVLGRGASAEGGRRDTASGVHLAQAALVREATDPGNLSRPV